jgi:phage shock protein PspC (stress-responsive transcriptional regulator)
MDARTSDEGRGEMRRCPYCYELIHAGALKCRYCRSVLDPARQVPPSKDGPAGKMFLGVCARLAARYQVPVTVVRLAFVLITLFHGFGILLYLILWAIMPGLNDGEEPKASHWIRSLRRFLWAVKKAFTEEVLGTKGQRTGSQDVEEARDMNTAESR